MYLTENLVTASVRIPDSYELTPELEEKYHTHRRFSKLVFDEDGNLTDIVEDTEKKAAWQAEQEALLPEKHRDDVRRQRARYLRAFDIYKSNVLYGVDTETEEEKAAVLAWYQTLLDLPSLATAEDVPEFPETPEGVEKYL